MTSLHAIAAQQHTDDLRRQAEQHRLRRHTHRERDGRTSRSHTGRGRRGARSLAIGLRRDPRGRAATAAMR